MQLSALLARLPEGSLESLRLTDPDADVYSVAFLTSVTDVLREDVVYFGDTTLLAGKPLPEQPNLVLYGSGTDETADMPPATNVAVLSANVDPFTCYNALQACFLEDQELTIVVRRMLQAHFSNRGLQYLIEEAALALNNPIVVVDNTYRYIAYHLADPEGSKSELEQTLTEELRNEDLMEEVIVYIHEQGIDRQIARSPEPLVRDNTMLGANTMTAAVMVNNVCVAHAMMIEHGHPFTATDRTCFARLAEFVGQELQKSELWSPTTGELGGVFLTNLLNDREPSETMTSRRMKALDFHPKRYLQTLCLHATGEGLGQLQAEHIAGQLKPLLHHAIYTRFHQQLVVLVTRDDEGGLDAYGERLIGEVCTLNDITCGVSNVYEHITQTRSAYDQARRAIRYGDRASVALGDQRLYYYRDYAYLHALDIADRRTNLLALCHPALLRLRAHDEEHAGELLDTLFCYLQLAGSTARAAKILALHKNTLLYRLNRIKQILGLDLTSGEDLFQLQMGFRILLYLGLFTPRVAVGRDELKG